PRLPRRGACPARTRGGGGEPRREPGAAVRVVAGLHAHGCRSGGQGGCAGDVARLGAVPRRAGGVQPGCRAGTQRDDAGGGAGALRAGAAGVTMDRLTLDVFLERIREMPDIEAREQVEMRRETLSLQYNLLMTARQDLAPH